MMKYFASLGYLSLVQWARAKGCPWNEESCSNTSLNGHLEVLKWLRENGCLWNAYTCSNAAENGHLEVLRMGVRNNMISSEIILTTSFTSYRFYRTQRVIPLE